MNWKQEAKEKLRDYEARKSAVEQIPEEIKRLEIAATSIRSATRDGTPVKGGGERQGGYAAIQHHTGMN